MKNDKNAQGEFAHWTTTGWFRMPAVGTSHYRDAIATIAQNPNGFPAHVICLAYLVLDNRNPHDSNAVQIHIEGKTVGFLSAEFAKVYRSYLKEVPADIAHFSVAAAITGGLVTKEKSYEYQIELDFPEKPSIVRSSSPVKFETLRNYGYGPLKKTADGSYRATVWLPSAELQDFHKKLLVDEWTTEHWATVNIYLANRKNVGLGFKIYEIPKQEYDKLFSGKQIDYSLELEDNRFAGLLLRC